MNPQAIAAQLERARLFWVDFPADAQIQQPAAGPLRMQLETPSQFQAARIVNSLRSGDGDAVIAVVAPLVRSWENVTEEFLLGAGVGNAEPVDCHPRLVAIVLADRPEWVTVVALKAAEAAHAARTKVAIAQGN